MSTLTWNVVRHLILALNPRKCHHLYCFVLSQVHEFLWNHSLHDGLVDFFQFKIGSFE